MNLDESESCGVERGGGEVGEYIYIGRLSGRLP